MKTDHPSRNLDIPCVFFLRGSEGIMACKRSVKVFVTVIGSTRIRCCLRPSLRTFPLTFKYYALTLINILNTKEKRIKFTVWFVQA